MTNDPEFQEALDARCDAIGAVVFDLIDTPVGLAATYWAMLGFASSIKAVMEGLETEETGTQAMKVAAHEAMGRVARTWNSIKREPFLIPTPDGGTMLFLGGQG